MNIKTKIIFSLIPLNFIMYNSLHYIDYRNADLSHLISTLYPDMPILELMTQVTENPLPRQLAFFLSLFFYALFIPYSFWVVLKTDGVFGFFEIWFSREWGIFKNFLCNFMSAIVGGSGTYVIFFMLDRELTSYGKALYLDFNLAVFISYFFYGFLFFMCLCIVNIPVYFFYFFNESFRNKINARINYVK